MFRKKMKEEISVKNKKKRSASGALPWREIYKNGVVKMDESTYIVICRFENAPYLSPPTLDR